MSWLRRLSASALMLLAATAAGGPSAEELSPNLALVLAPTRTLRVGIYLGSPTSALRDASGQMRGMTVEVGQELGRRLGIPVAFVEFPRVAEVVDAIAAGRVDVTVTNASPARAERVDFTEPVLALELGFLVPSGSGVVGPADLDAPGRRVGVTEGGTSERTLARVLPHARLVPVPSVGRAGELLGAGGLDAFATNKSVLFQLSDALPGSRVLDGRWGVEHLAVAVPKGRSAAAPYLTNLVHDMRANGSLAGAATRAGLRGQAPAAP